MSNTFIEMKILMVCLGNICRSPIAEGILRLKVQERNLNIETDSAGTASYHIGESPDKRMVLAAKKNGVDISDLRAREFVKEDFQNFDVIYAMDKANYINILKLANSDDDRDKVKMILNEINPNSEEEVPDPYYGGEQGFQNVIEMLDEAIEIIMEKIDV